jgi:hypothetical protein
MQLEAAVFSLTQRQLCRASLHDTLRSLEDIGALAGTLAELTSPVGLT